jgi:hypothetical protein
VIILPLSRGSLTHETGIAAYSLAAASSAVAWIRARDNPKTARFAAFLTIAEVALLFDIIFDWRWALHSFMLRQSMERNIYVYRRVPQTIILFILTAVVLFGFGFIKRQLHGRNGALIATWGLLLSISCWCVEIISLHATDLILYHFAGGVMIVAFLWIVACIMTAVGIQLDHVASPVTN